MSTRSKGTTASLFASRRPSAHRRGFGAFGGVAALLLALLLALPAPVAFAADGSVSDASAGTQSAEAALLASLDEGTVAVVFTNDVHCAIDSGLGYAGFAAYVDAVEAQLGEQNVSLVDAGDAVQGAAVGTLTEGSAIIEIMNEVGYDYAVAGNHEYDYGMDRFFELVEMADFEYLSSNFTDLRTGELVFSSYDIAVYEDVMTEDGTALQVAYVGITTPETLTKSTPTSFLDEDGTYIYGFCEDETGEALYEAVQASVDEAIEAGADYVVAIGHLGESNITERWTSDAVIANTTGIDAFIDGHSHEQYVKTLENEVGEAVPLAQTGTQFAAAGTLVIDPDAADGEDVSFLALTEAGDFTDKDASMQSYIDGVNAELAELTAQVVGRTDVDLRAWNEETGLYARWQETNLGDLVADAYRSVLNADIGITNGGGIRANIPAGDITYGQLIDVQPYDNELCLVEVSGQTVVDALERGAMELPESSGGFLQVSGISYEVRTDIPSSVVIDEHGAFVGVDGERRVSNVLVNGEPIDLEGRYTVASHNYLLLEGGSGMTMFQSDDCEVLLNCVILDNQALIEYLTEELGGTVGEEYSSSEGAGRITIDGASSAYAAVETLIAALPSPEEVAADDEDAVYAARAAYAALSEAQQAYVTNLADLVAVEEALGRALAAQMSDLVSPDGEEHWVLSEGWIATALGRGLVTGYIDSDIGFATGRFGPDDTLTRGQAATILYRWANPSSTATTVEGDYATSDGTFSDLPERSYYNAAIQWCAQQGIVSGYDDPATGESSGTFGPDDPVTREQLAKMIAEAARWAGLDISADLSALESFADADEASDFAVEYLAWCAQAGVFTGNAATGDLDPTDAASRAMAVKASVRLMELVEA